MKVTITSIQLKGPFQFFILSAHALQILKQLKATECKDFKKQGIWTMHYTMTLWDNEDQLMRFAKTGAHQQAMKKSAAIAKEIRTITIDADQLPSWKEAKALLLKAKVLKFG